MRPTASSKKSLWAGMALVGACAGCCALPVVSVLGIGAVASTAWVFRPRTEVMQRIAAPMIGRIITAPLLPLFVIPAAQRILRYERLCHTQRQTMSFYQEHVLPHVINLAMRNRHLLPYRKRALSAAAGKVLEIGIGSGLNLRFYPAQVQELVGLEPAPRLAAMARHAATAVTIPTTFIEASAEAIPLEDRSFDTVVTTWTLCTIPDVAGALREMRRVLKPQGRLLFVEHGQAPEERVRRWQDRLTPAWRCVGGGCHLNRPIRALVESAGFAIMQIETGYMRGPKPMTFMYEGRAAPASHHSP